MAHNRAAQDDGFVRPRGATKREQDRAEFLAARKDAIAALNPTPENIHLGALRFVARCVKDLNAIGTTFETEQAMYVAVYAARKAAHGPMTTREADSLRRASQAFWMACDRARPVITEVTPVEFDGEWTTWGEIMQQDRHTVRRDPDGVLRGGYGF